MVTCLLRTRCAPGRADPTLPRQVATLHGGRTGRADRAIARITVHRHRPGLQIAHGAQGRRDRGRACLRVCTRVVTTRVCVLQHSHEQVANQVPRDHRVTQWRIEVHRVSITSAFAPHGDVASGAKIGEHSRDGALRHLQLLRHLSHGGIRARSQQRQSCAVIREQRPAWPIRLDHARSVTDAHGPMTRISGQRTIVDHRLRDARRSLRRVSSLDESGGTTENILRLQGQTALLGA